MTFVNELIPEEQKASLPFPVRTRPDGSKPTLYKWTIDRQRDACLVFTRAEGGAYEGTPLVKHFVLSWHGALVQLRGEPGDSFRDEAGRAVMPWDVRDVQIPESLKGREAEVFDLIRNAFRVHGNLYDGEGYDIVEVKISLSSNG